MTSGKYQKGTVKVESDKGWLRIRFSFQGKRYAFALGLPDSEVNKKVARSKANQIELDILSGNFDPTLIKYKPPKVGPDYREGRLTVPALFEDFIRYKAKHVTPKTQEKYQATLKYVQEHFAGRPVDFVGIADCEGFVAAQKKAQHPTNGRKLSPVQIKRRVEELQACWEWKRLDLNPWKQVKKQIKPNPKQLPWPFIKTEIEAILNEFKRNPYYCHYYDFVRFLFGTGLRTGECIGLRYRHITEDCTSLWIGEIVTRGKLRPVKKGKTRTVILNQSMSQLLRDRKPKRVDKNALVFPSPEGQAIDDHNFSRRGWKTVLEESGIEYRKLYNTRSSFISHALASGMHPTTVSQITGHELESLYHNYAASIETHPKLPEF